jgi:LPS export ABC transporter protein LptC
MFFIKMRTFLKIIWSVKNKLKSYGRQITLLVATALALISCENDIEVVKSFSGDSLMPSQTMINVVTNYTDSARLQLRITTPEINYYSTVTENYTEFPQGVFAEFFDRNENVESSLKSKYAIYFQDKELWEAKDSVVVVNRDGEILETDQLFWDERKKIIFSHSFVRVTRPNEEITGEGFEADETFSRWNIRKVQGTITLQDEP